MLGQAADTVLFVGLRTGIQLARPLVSQSARLPGLPGVLPASELPAQRASTSPDVSGARGCRGVKLPGCKANSSSRGKKTCPTVWAGPILPAQCDVLSSRSLQLALSLSSRMQRGATHWTAWPLLWTRSTPGSARTLLGRILDQSGFQSTHSLVDARPQFPARVALGWLCRHSVISVRICSLRSRQCSSGGCPFPPPLVVALILAFSSPSVYPLCKNLTPTRRPPLHDTSLLSEICSLFARFLTCRLRRRE